MPRRPARAHPPLDIGDPGHWIPTLQLEALLNAASPTIDLGLVLPGSDEPLDIQQPGSHHPRHRGTRHAMFFAWNDGRSVTLTHLFVTTGADSFGRFRRFEGKVTDGKIQIPLPRDFFQR